jgi:serine/threonine protein kinase
LHKADIFSLGITIYELVTRKPLPPRDDSWRSIREGKNLDFPPTLSAEFVDLVKKMMSLSPSDRPSVAQVLQSSLLLKQSPLYKIVKLKQKSKAFKDELEQKSKRICLLEKELELRVSDDRRRLQELEQMVLVLLKSQTSTQSPFVFDSNGRASSSLLSPSLPSPSDQKTTQFQFSPPPRLNL